MQTVSVMLEKEHLFYQDFLIKAVHQPPKEILLRAACPGPDPCSGFPGTRVELRHVGSDKAPPTGSDTRWKPGWQQSWMTENIPGTLSTLISTCAQVPSYSEKEALFKQQLYQAGSTTLIESTIFWLAEKPLTCLIRPERCRISWQPVMKSIF